MIKQKCIWYRLGDQDDYHCVDGVIELAEALKEVGVKDDFDHRNGRITHSDSGFYGWNYISAYWGDNSHQPEATEWLSKQHVAVLREELKFTT